MSATIFPSLVTFFSGGGHHSPPHPTISPQLTITLKNHHGVEKITESSNRGTIMRPEGYIRKYLERLVATDNVQKFVSENLFGPLGAQTSLEPGPAILLLVLILQRNHKPLLAGTTTNYQQDWPFIKQSPIWATIDSLVSCLTPPQKPHFSPLKKTKGLHREGLAIAHVLTCYNLVQSLPNIKLNDPVDIINGNLEVLVDLEAHGKEMDQLKVEMQKLQEKMMHAETMRKA
ncbi:hypothetical protein Hanom_Chr16g01493561 [Helianthus anomalus]